MHLPVTMTGRVRRNGGQGRANREMTELCISIVYARARGMPVHGEDRI